MRKGLPANEVWLQLLAEVASSPTKVSPRGQPVRELLAHQTVIDMTQPVVTFKQRKLGRRFMAAEAWWILSGRNDVASIAPYSKDIANFSNDGRRFDGAYGPKIVDQLRYVCDALIDDNHTRQAVLNIWRENPRLSRDVACTTSLQWLIRDGKLHCVDTMRSSDVWLGIPYDWVNMSMLSAMILLTIRERDKHLRGLQLGDLILTAGSQHLYDRNFLACEELFRNLESTPYQPLHVDEFKSPEELVRHLELLKDRKQAEAFVDGRTWMDGLFDA